MAGPTVVATYALGSFDATSPRTQALSWLSGDIIWVGMAIEWDFNAPATPTLSGITWTEHVIANETTLTGESTEIHFWGVIAGADGSGTLSASLSTADSTYDYWIGACGIIRDHGGFGTSSVANDITSTLTGVAANSLILASVAAWATNFPTDATLTPTEATAGTYTSVNSGGAADHGNAFLGYYADTGTAGDKTIGGTVTWASPRSAGLEILKSTGADTEAPTAPTSLATSSPTSSGGHLTWTQGTDNVAVTQNVIYVDGSPHATIAAATSYDITGLSASTTYSITVSAKDAAGNESSQSGSASLTTTAPDPTPVYAAESTEVDGGTSIIATLPAGIAAGNLLLRFINTKPGTSNPSTPAGWTEGGYLRSTRGQTQGADTGDTLSWCCYKIADGSETGTQTHTITGGSSGSAWTALITNETGLWNLAFATGEDSSYGAAVSATTGNLDLAPGDMVWALFSIPTDVTTPAQFTAEAFSATGITFDTFVETQEPDATTGNDSGGVIGYAMVTAGTGSVPVTFTATASGTTTNVAGPVLLVRVRGESGGPFEGTASGNYNFAGSASGSVVHEGTTSAAYSFAGTSSGSMPTSTSEGTATGSYQFSSSTSGSAEHDGTSNATYSFTTAATGSNTDVIVYIYSDTDSVAYFFASAPGTLFVHLDDDGITPYVSAVSTGALTVALDTDHTTAYVQTNAPNSGTAGGAYDFAGASTGAASNGGASSGAYTFASAASGAVAHDGSSSGVYTFASSASGAATHDGVSTGSYTFTSSATGSALNGGTSSGTYTFASTASGSVAHDGSTAGSYTFASAAGGSHTAEGSSSSAYTFAGSASGSTHNNGSSSGSYTFAGAASSSVQHNGVAGGAYSFSSYANGYAPVVGSSNGSASGTYTFTSSASGTKTANGTISSSYTFASSASGQKSVNGTASGAYDFSGTAAGSAPVVGSNNGSASGSYTFASTASGERISQGASSSAYSLIIATAVGETTRDGFVTTSYSFNGSASGFAGTGGYTSGSYSFALDGSGSTDPVGSVSGSYSFASVASGEFTPVGESTGLYDFAVLASGLIDTTGLASGVYTFALAGTGASTTIFTNLYWDGAAWYQLPRDLYWNGVAWETLPQDSYWNGAVWITEN